MWLCHHSGIGLRLKAGDRVFLGERALVVTDLAVACLPTVRAYLIGVARAGGTVTYGEIKRDLALPYPPNGLGYLLDVVSVDCIERGEPSLAALVVAAGTFEVGRGYTTDPDVERELLYRRWLSQTVEGGGLEQLGPIRGTCPSCGSTEVTRIVWGMVEPDAYQDPMRPPWLNFGGCVVEPFDAVCGACGQKWWATEDGKSAVFRDAGDLYFYADARTAADLGHWISETTELDAHIEGDGLAPEALIVRFHQTGVRIEFPVTLSEFWETVNELHDQVENEIETSESDENTAGQDSSPTH